MKTVFRVGLMGCGRIAPKHADSLTSNGGIPGANLVAVCDVVPDRAHTLARKYGVDAYTSLEEMVTEKELDLVHVLTPSGLHAQHAVEAFQRGLHCVVEKPLALTLGDAGRMIDAADRAGRRLFLIKQNRFNNAIQAARRALEAGRFGRLVVGSVRVRWCRRQEYYDQDAWRGTWALDGGVVANQASHHVDLLRWFFGEVDTVHAMMATRLARIETEDTAVATLQFRNGSLGVIEATTATRPSDLEGSLSILGERGTIVIGGFAVNKIETWEFEQHLPEDDEILKEMEMPPNVYGFGHRKAIEDIVRCLHEERPAMVEGEEARQSLSLIAALYESAALGEPVKLSFEAKVSRLGQG